MYLPRPRPAQDVPVNDPDADRGRHRNHPLKDSLDEVAGIKGINPEHADSTSTLRGRLHEHGMLKGWEYHTTLPLLTLRWLRRSSVFFVMV
jgi:hypothetical protein